MIEFILDRLALGGDKISGSVAIVEDDWRELMDRASQSYELETLDWLIKRSGLAVDKNTFLIIPDIQ